MTSICNGPLGWQPDHAGGDDIAFDHDYSMHFILDDESEDSTDNDQQSDSCGSPSTESTSSEMDTVHIPRPSNPFILFRNDYTSKHQRGGPKIRRRTGPPEESLSKQAGKAWRKLDEAEKRVWRDKAEVEKQLHKQRYPHYRFRPNKRPDHARSASKTAKEKVLGAHRPKRASRPSALSRSSTSSSVPMPPAELVCDFSSPESTFELPYAVHPDVLHYDSYEAASPSESSSSAYTHDFPSPPYLPSPGALSPECGFANSSLAGWNGEPALQPTYPAMSWNTATNPADFMAADFDYFDHLHGCRPGPDELPAEVQMQLFGGVRDRFPFGAPQDIIISSH
ncbi:hypothetical protein CYLTODRAFT_486411 [Cylindrobasidium torrendii FP15055 ss-10]|uniref:HMG box domain-containing protein n=1 Tax=Cylindrobasidium torrendii FP15055 ss-10 TaxID=1314674 RepID=A0A0D7BQ78_9AGAR|nr:hypothetical protein CYLTODRAFT_486411 [Cylindrobasidium torrendii FP15055 ss-10]